MNIELLVSFELTLAGINLLLAGNHPPMCGPNKTNRRKENIRKPTQKCKYNSRNIVKAEALPILAVDSVVARRRTKKKWGREDARE